MAGNSLVRFLALRWSIKYLASVCYISSGLAAIFKFSDLDGGYKSEDLDEGFFA